jgi:hypothetical protein
MKRKATPRKHSLLVVILVAAAVLILLLRMLVFVAGHGRHRF